MLPTKKYWQLIELTFLPKTAAKSSLKSAMPIHQRLFQSLEN